MRRGHITHECSPYTGSCTGPGLEGTRGVPKPADDAEGDPRISESLRGRLAGWAEYEEPRRRSMPLSPLPESRPPLGVLGIGRPRESVWDQLCPDDDERS